MRRVRRTVPTFVLLALASGCSGHIDPQPPGATGGTGASAAGSPSVTGPGGSPAVGGGGTSAGGAPLAGGGGSSAGGWAGAAGAGGTGGTAISSGGEGGAPPDSGGASVCRPAFTSGTNVAWNDFARDVPDPDIGFFNQLFSDVSEAGGNAVRWWFHTNGSSTPGYDDSGRAKNIDQATIDGIELLLDAAHEQGISLIISLWSFDMLQADQSGMTEAVLANNKRLLQEDEYRQAYIDRVLEPLVTALKGHPALHSWEIFNEPEGMTNDYGWSSQRVNMADIQKTVNWFADAIHAADPDAHVTNGSWSFKACSDVDGNYDYYRDDRLIERGGRSQGTLDYVEVHYYSAFGQGNSPFEHAASHWQPQKPLVVGEFWPDDTYAVSRADLFTKLYELGYAGGWSWQYIERWNDMVAPIQKLASEHSDALSCP